MMPKKVTSECPGDKAPWYNTFMGLLEKYKLDLNKNSELYLKVKAISGAPKTEFKGEMADGTIKIAVAAAPEKGRANAELLDFLAGYFGVSKKGAMIIAGVSSRTKLVKIKNT